MNYIYFKNDILMLRNFINLKEIEDIVKYIFNPKTFELEKVDSIDIEQNKTYCNVYYLYFVTQNLKIKYTIDKYENYFFFWT